ncbi:type II toxin-antitoxin system VapC family toxin [Microcoleus vaginatus]|uniref:type II toxin-antitoxin system VapC family toxin n=1 Tax=Microcoleus vaginatus TaxID=119532 RepID=UPI0016828EA4|nr:type II toxin-antitoxin system VapC family toxin [Microcoleus sp. FACHB-84]MBD2011517.1 type II toxin-antitoxin system VapC family toxin [Microcoleus sp. FACHB-45]
MLRAVADTHAVILYIFGDSRLSVTARTTIEEIAAQGNQVAFSSITLAEIVYLSERGRINSTTLDLLLREVESDDALVVEIPFDRNIALTLRQVDRSQIPDLPDRIIAATALYLNVPVISRDRRIQLSSIDTIW